MTVGTRIDNRFVLVEPIGAGGLSQVWRAWDEVLGRIVAVKVLTGPVATDPALRDLPWREARATARLTHPNVAQVYDYGEAALPDGTLVPYLVMELVRGTGLTERLAGAPLTWPEAARVGAEVAAALAAAHQVGVVHRDVKPANVIITPAGAKVLDFGIAGLAGAVEGDRFAGTPTYTAPERLDGSAAQPANDVYSLGVLLFELLTGRPPATFGDWEQAVAAHRHGDLPRSPLVGDLPDEIRDLVATCLSPDPAQRPPARQVAATLAGAAGMADPAATLPGDQATMMGAPPVEIGPPPGTARSGRAATAAGSGYAVGTAALPPPHTRVDHAPPAPPGRSRSRFLPVAGAVVTVVLLALGAGLVAAALQDDGRDQSPPPVSGDGPPATPSPDPTGPATSQEEALAGLRDLLADRPLPALGGDAAEKLRQKIDDVLAEYEEGDDEEVREELTDLLEDVDDLEEDRELPPGIARELRRQIERALTLFAG